MMKDKLVKFLKIYLVFMAFALLVNTSMEMLIPSPEEKHLLGIVMFYIIFNLIGGIIFLVKDYDAKMMGAFSLLLGFIFEFSFMRPDWVQKIFAFSIEGGVVVAVIVSAFYWFIAWGAPSYVLHKYIMKSDRIRQKQHL